MSIIDAYIGHNPVDEVYLGSQLVFKRLHPYTQKVLDEADLLGFTKPSSIYVFDTFIRDLVSSGIWDLLDVLYMFASDLGADFNFRRINLINPKKNLATPYGGLIWTSEGVKGNGSNGYIDTNFNPSRDGVNYRLNNASRGGLFSESSVNWEISIISSANKGAKEYWGANANCDVRFNSNSAFSKINLDGGNFKIISRDNASQFSSIQADIAMSFALKTTELTNDIICLLKAAGSFSKLKVQLFFMGASISFAQSQEFRRITNKYLKSINLNEIA